MKRIVNFKSTHNGEHIKNSRKISEYQIFWWGWILRVKLGDLSKENLWHKGLGGVGGKKGIKNNNCKKVCCLLIIKNKETFYLVVVLSYIMLIVNFFSRKSPFYNSYPSGVIFKFILNKRLYTQKTCNLRIDVPFKGGKGG